MDAGLVQDIAPDPTPQRPAPPATLANLANLTSLLPTPRDSILTNILTTHDTIQHRFPHTAQPNASSDTENIPPHRRDDATEAPRRWPFISINLDDGFWQVPRDAPPHLEAEDIQNFFQFDNDELEVDILQEFNNHSATTYPPPQHRPNIHGVHTELNIPPANRASPAIVANATFRTPLLPLSAQMPHIRIPIGSDEEGKDATLLAMLDTGAGCNLGRKSYHLQVQERCPDLVASVESIETNKDWSDIHIGSIEDKGAPVIITAVIVYCTPFVIDGHPIELRIGLAENAAINTVIGLPFLRAAQAVVHFQGSRHSPDQLVCPKLGINLPITMQPTTCTDEPVYVETPDRCSLVTFSANSEVRDGYLVSPDTAALVNPQMETRQAEDCDDFLIWDTS